MSNNFVVRRNRVTGSVQKYFGDVPAETPMVGLSLSISVKDMCNGKVDPAKVFGLLTCTCCRSEAEFEGVLDRYAVRSWGDFPEEAKNLARRFWAEGKIQQPNLDDPEFGHPSFSAGNCEEHDYVGWFDVTRPAVRVS